MSGSIWTMGEILVEIMRPSAGMALDVPGAFLGPFPSGAPAIFIDTVARLGHPAGIIGGVGEDDFGRCVLSRLERDGVDCRGVRGYPGDSTAVAFVTYFEDGSRRFLYHIDRTPAVFAQAVQAPFTDLEGEIGFFHVMGCSLMANEDFRAQIIVAMQAARARGARVSFDPNIRPELLRGRPLEAVAGPVLENCSVLLPGMAELALLSGSNDVEAGAARLFETYPLEWIVVKRGRQGASVYGRDGSSAHVPAFPVREVDPTGAGDCFDAAFLVGLLEDRPPVECARMAAAAGALNATVFGPMEGDISRETVEELMKG